LNGDRNGSPHGAPGQSTPLPSGDGSEQGTGWEAPRMPDFGTPPTDVKVAGPPEPAASTAVLSPPREEWSRDEVAGGGPRRSGRRSVISLSRPALPKVAVVAAVAAVVVGGGAVAAFALTGGSDEGKVANAVVIPSKPAPASAQADPAGDPAVARAEAAALRRQILGRASRAARKDSGKHPVLGAKGSPLPSATPSGGSGGGGDPVPAGTAQQIAKKLLPSYGFGGTGQFGCLVNLWNRESHWNTHAASPSGAYGIPQALPGSKMGSAGPDWQNDATTQIKWGLGYIKSRYGTPCGAWGHSQSTGWY
jgi:hypothetical protein